MLYFIGFLISAVLLNVYTIICFFVKKFICSNVYTSVNAIFECLYIIFWLRKGPLMKYLRNWQLVGDGGIPQNAYRCVQGEGKSCLMCMYALTPSFFMFLVTFLSYSVLFYLQKFNFTFFFFDVFVRNSYFSPRRSISVVMK